MTPTYYVQHPDGSYSVADPQPQQDAQCGLCGADRPFTGSCGGGRENPRALCFADRVPLAQQDAQAVPPKVWPDVMLPKPELLVWRGGKLHGAGFSAKQVRKCAKDYALSMLNAAPTPPAQAVPVGAIERVRKALAGRKFRETTDLEDLLRMAANVIAEDGSVIGHMKAKISAPTPPAQQDAQVVQEPCAVVKWQTGGPVVHIIGDVQVGDLLYRASPTPPAQAVPPGYRLVSEKLLADAVTEKSTEIESLRGSYNREMTKCHGCGVVEDGWMDGDLITHKSDCAWVAQQKAIAEIRAMLSATPNAETVAAMQEARQMAAQRPDHE